MNRIGAFWRIPWCWAFVHNLHSKIGTSVRDRIFENFRKSKYRSKFLIWFLGITHQRVSLEKLWAIRKSWSCPEILDGYRKSLLKCHLLVSLPQCGKDKGYKQRNKRTNTAKQKPNHVFVTTQNYYTVIIRGSHFVARSYMYRPNPMYP